MSIEWWDECCEGYCTEALDGYLEEVSGLVVLDEAWNLVAEGWMDFIHGGSDNPLHVVWLFLDLFEAGQRKKVKEYPTIPDHVWRRLSESQRDLCTRDDVYDCRWAKDPLVRAWKEKEANGNGQVS